MILQNDLNKKNTKELAYFCLSDEENWHIGNNRLLNRHWKSSDLMCHLQCLKVNLINFVYRRFLVSPPWLLLRVLMLVTLSMLTDVLDYSQCASRRTSVEEIQTVLPLIATSFIALTLLHLMIYYVIYFMIYYVIYFMIYYVLYFLMTKQKTAPLAKKQVYCWNVFPNSCRR